MSDTLIVFCAEYLVILEGLLLLILSLETGDLVKSLGVFLSATLLLILSLAVTKVLKRIFHKHRPSKKNELFVPFDRYAFPSGHATGLASVTTCILSYNLVLGLLSCLVSIIIVSARIRSHVHDSYDMIVGACVGTVITYTLLGLTVQYVFSYLIPALLT